MKDDALYVAHIVASAGKIEQYSKCGLNEFLSGGQATDAILRNLQILAESAKKLSDELKASHPDIPGGRSRA